MNKIELGEKIEVGWNYYLKVEQIWSLRVEKGHKRGNYFYMCILARIF
jgi:hypothetical protein